MARRDPLRVHRAFTLRGSALREQRAAVDVRHGVSGCEPPDPHRAVQRSLARGVTRLWVFPGRRAARHWTRGGGAEHRRGREGETQSAPDCVAASVQNRRLCAPRRCAGDPPPGRKRLLAGVSRRYPAAIGAADDKHSQAWRLRRKRRRGQRRETRAGICSRCERYRIASLSGRPRPAVVETHERHREHQSPR